MSHPKYDVVIAGTGPVGLFAACEAAKTGKKILLIGKNPKTESQPATVSLEPERIQQLINLVTSKEKLSHEDKNFLQGLILSSEVATSALKSFLLNRIAQSPSIELRHETSLTKINLANGEATLKSGNKTSHISFEHLIAADGVKSRLLQLINENIQDPEMQQSTPDNIAYLEQSFHAAATVNISRKDGKDIPLPENEVVMGRIDNELYFLKFDPIEDDPETIKAGFIGEMPRELHIQCETILLQNNLSLIFIQSAYNEIVRNIKNPSHISEDTEAEVTELVKEKNNLLQERTRLIKQANDIVLSYIKRGIAKNLGMPETELIVEFSDPKKNPTKDHLKILRFEGERKEANQAAMAVNGHGFFLVGDSYFAPRRATTHDVNAGLETAGWVSDLLLQLPTENTRETLRMALVVYNDAVNQSAHNQQNMVLMKDWLVKEAKNKAKTKPTSFFSNPPEEEVSTEGNEPPHRRKP